jgi:hypothetical protein
VLNEMFRSPDLSGKRVNRDLGLTDTIPGKLGTFDLHELMAFFKRKVDL